MTPDVGQGGAPDQLRIAGAEPAAVPGHAVLEGIVERIVYENADSGFLVARLRAPDTAELVTFVGSGIAVSPGETIRIEGEWVDDARFGRQLKVSRYQTLLPTSVDGIEKYLASGLVNGIGPVYAKRLVEAFGAETLKVIDESPERLRHVEGIGRKRAQQIREAWEKQRDIQSIMVFLQGLGVGTAHAVRIYKQYGDRATAVLRENPYRLAEDVAGIGFAGADKIASSMGIAGDAPRRIAAGLVHALTEAAGQGQMYLPRTELIERAKTLLNVDTGAIESVIDASAREARLVVEDDGVSLPLLHEEELGVANALVRLQRATKSLLTIKAEAAAPWCEKQFGIAFSHEQRQALIDALNAPVYVITGGPGTGKTTLIRSLVTVFEKKGLRVMLTAPTGRAAKRMESSTGHEARTIHRLLEYSPRTREFTHNALNPLDLDVLIVDETSMVDVPLMDALLKAMPDDARLYLIGDVDQLPSVGPGTALMDIIASGAVPCARLGSVFRQAAESGIITAAHAINRGETPRANTTDFFIIERDTPEKIQQTVVELVTERIPNRFKFDSLTDIQVLTPIHRGAAGVEQLNAALQDALNPRGRPVPSRTLRVGDKVIQLRNNYDLDVYNGDVGAIATFDEDANELDVQFEDRRIIYEPADLDNLALAYAITIHKSQGSEYPAIVVPVARQHFTMLQRNVLYTAVTRAKQLVVLVGDPRALATAVRNTQASRRYTRLADRLRKAAKKST